MKNIGRSSVRVKGISLLPTILKWTPFPHPFFSIGPPLLKKNIDAPRQDQDLMITDDEVQLKR